MKKEISGISWIPLLTLLGFYIFSSSNLYAQPANDNLCNAAALVVGASCSGTPNGNNTNATAQAGEPVASCYSGGTNSAWFSFVAPASGLVTISTDFPIGTNDDTEIALYDLPGGNCSSLGSLVELACSQDISFTNYLSFIPVTSVTPGQTYYVSVSGWNGTQGTFCIEVNNAIPPINDSLCNATPLIVGGSCSGMTNGDNTNATAEPGEPLATCFVGGPNSVWYTFIGPPSGLVNITTDNGLGTNHDTEIALYALPGGNCMNPSGLVQLACDQDIGNGNYMSAITGGVVTPGQLYFIQVSGWDGTEGTFCITVDAVTAPSNDSLCNATPLVMGAGCNGTTNGDNASASFQGGEPMASCSNGVNTVWYSFVGPSSGFVRLRTDTTGVGGTNALTSMGLFVLPGGNCQTPMDLFEINCAPNNGFNGALLDSIVVTPGETYYIQVSGGAGSFCIHAEEVNPSFSAPINDTLCNAIPLIVGGSCNPNNPNGNNMGATFEINEPVGSCFVGGTNSVWYTFIGPPSGYVNVTTNLPVGAGFSTNDDTELAVYELPNGDCYDLTDLNEVGCNQDLNANISHAEIPILQVNPGVLYFIQVSGYNGAEGAFCIEVSSTAPIANDEPCDAVLLPVDGTTVTNGNNMGATVKLNENLISPPTNDGDGFDGWNESDIEASVWYKFVAPSSGAVFVDLCNNDFGGGTNFDTQVAIYSSSDCSDFTQFTLKGANDDLIGCQSLFASYLEVFCLTPGETFFVLVDGWDGEIGSFGIRMGEIIRPLMIGSVDLDPSCTGDNDGRIQVVGNGGNGEYSFIWNDGDTTALRTELSIGIYTVSMEDGCDSIVTQSFVLAGNPDLNVEAGDDQLVCKGDSVELGGLNIATGGSRILSDQGFVINADNQKFSSFSLKDPENLSQATSAVTNPTVGGDFIDGTFYALDRINNRLIRIDTVSGGQTVVGSTLPATGEGWTGLAYDPANSILYGLTVAQNATNDVFTTRLYTIDPVTAMATAGAMVDIDVLTAFAIDNNGMAYGIDALANHLVTLDLTNGSTSAIGSTGYEASLIEDADFDPETNQLYIIASDEGGTGSGYELRLADLNSGATIPVGAFTGGFEPGGFGISSSTAIPYSFSWTPAMDLSDPFAANPKLEAKTSGTYIVTVTDACMEVVTDTVEVTVSPALLASPTSTPDNGTGNGSASANASGGIPPYSYQWSNGSTTETITGLDSGTYSVTVFDSLGCSTNSVVEIGSNVGIDDWANAGISTLQVYPNPTQGLINIEMELLTLENVSMEIIDLRGKILMKRTQINGVFIDEVINIERFPSGIYLLKIATTKGAVHQRITRL